MINNELKQGFSMGDLVPITDLQRAPGKIIERLHKTKSPLLVTQRGRVTALLIDKDHYEALLSHAVTDESTKEKRKKELLQALDEMLPLIIRDYQPEKIILFGSLAEDRVQETSDIDLVIIKKTKKRALERRKEILKIAQPKVATDFFVYTPGEVEQCRQEKRNFFLSEIDQKGKVLYEKAT